MDLESFSSPTFLPAALLLAILAASILLASAFHASSRTPSLPPGPPAFPVIGNLHLLGTIPHQTLAHLSKQYGPLMFLRLGSIPAVVVSNASLAKEFLLTHDRVFASRPRLEITKRLAFGWDNGVVMTLYGPRWREIRKICTLELLSTRRLQDFQHVRMEEIALLVRDLEVQSQGGKLPINIGKSVGNLTSNVMGRMMIGKRLSESSAKDGASLKDLIHEMSMVFVAPVIGDYIPYLGWLDVKIKRIMDHLHDRIDNLVEGILAERQHDREKNPGDAPNDFLDVLLSNHVGSEAGRLSKDTVKGTMVDIISAGVDTSAITVEWAMAELLRNPLTLKKLQDEVNMVVGGAQNTVQESDITHLPYLKAVIKETFRLHPPTPLLLPHTSTAACKVAGYTIPENTRLFVNAWAIGRDPQIWENPEKFWPERFKDTNIDLRGQNFELIPFGSGRRSCPGVAVALSMVELTVSNLVHSFDWELACGEAPTNLDMAEKAGVTVCKAKPLLAIPKPRLRT